MNIFFLGLSVNPTLGGLEKYSFINLKYLSDHNHKIYFYTLDRKAETEGQAHLTGESLTWVNSAVPRWKYADKFLRPWRLYHYLKDKQIDLIFCGHLHLTPIAHRLSLLLGKKFDLFVYGIDCWGGQLSQYKPYLTHLRYVASISTFTTQQVIAQNISAERILYVPPVITNDLGHSPTTTTTKTTATKAKSPFILLTVGRLAPDEQYKGHDLVIKSLPQILEMVPEVEYWIVGRGSDQVRLEKLVAERNLQDKVKFWGFVSEEKLQEIYAQSNVFVLLARVSLDPSSLAGEGFGIVFIEAALYEKPLIGPNIGGPTDIIVSGENGFQVDPLDPKEFVQKIIALSQSPEICLAMGKKAKKLVQEKFSLTQLPHYLAPLLKNEC